MKSSSVLHLVCVRHGRLQRQRQPPGFVHPIRDQRRDDDPGPDLDRRVGPTPGAPDRRRVHGHLDVRECGSHGDVRSHRPRGRGWRGRRVDEAVRRVGQGANCLHIPVRGIVRANVGARVVDLPAGAVSAARARQGGGAGDVVQLGVQPGVGPIHAAGVRQHHVEDVHHLRGLLHSHVHPRLLLLPRDGGQDARGDRGYVRGPKRAQVHGHAPLEDARPDQPHRPAGEGQRRPGEDGPVQTRLGRRKRPAGTHRRGDGLGGMMVECGPGSLTIGSHPGASPLCSNMAETRWGVGEGLKTLSFAIFPINAGVFWGG